MIRNKASKCALSGVADWMWLCVWPVKTAFTGWNDKICTEKQWNSDASYKIKTSDICVIYKNKKHVSKDYYKVPKCGPETGFGNFF